MQEKPDAWNVSTVNILTRLKAIPAPPAHLGVQDLKYTVLDPRHVYRDASELAELHSCDPAQLVNSFVAFRPERLALHEAIVGVVTTVQVAGEEEMQAAVLRVHDALLKEDLINVLHKQRTEIEHKSASLVDAYLSADVEGLDPIVIQSCNTVRNRPNGYVFGQYKSLYTERDAMVALVTDRLFAIHATHQLKASVKYIIQQDESLELITPPPPSDRLTLMVTGGISSGKGSSVATIKHAAEVHGVQWSNIAKVNGDSLKSLLLDASDVRPELFSQLAQEEASILSKLKIKGELRQLINRQEAPHMFLDQTRIEEDAKWGVKHGGRVVGLVVSTHVEAAIPRAAIRGHETGRYEATQNIVGNHKAVAEEFMTVFEPLAGMEAQFTLYDNNVEKGSAPIRVMTIDSKNKEISVLDESRLDSFVRKCNINPKATGSHDLYSGTKTRTQYLDDLKLKSGYDLKLPESQEVCEPTLRIK